jgi:hypothetical protein
MMEPEEFDKECVLDIDVLANADSTAFSMVTPHSKLPKCFAVAVICSPYVTMH